MGGILCGEGSLRWVCVLGGCGGLRGGGWPGMWDVEGDVGRGGGGGEERRERESLLFLEGLTFSYIVFCFFVFFFVLFFFSFFFGEWGGALNIPGIFWVCSKVIVFGGIGSFQSGRMLYIESKL